MMFNILMVKVSIISYHMIRLIYDTSIVYYRYTSYKYYAYKTTYKNYEKYII